MAATPSRLNGSQRTLPVLLDYSPKRNEHCTNGLLDGNHTKPLDTLPGAVHFPTQPTSTIGNIDTTRRSSNANTLLALCSISVGSKPHKAACKNNSAVQQRVPIYVAHSTMATYRATTVRTCFLGKSLALALLGHLATAASEASRTTTKTLTTIMVFHSYVLQTTRTHNSLTITSHIWGSTQCFQQLGDCAPIATVSSSTIYI